jgi:hypothetical protein
MTGSRVWQLMAETDGPVAAPWLGEMEMDLWPYRDRTVAILKRYARSSVEVGRLPSLLGREFFRSRVTSYSLGSFEDIVIFVHDVERALEHLDAFQGKLIAMNVLEEYSRPEVARLVGCPLRTVERVVPEALDGLSRLFLEGGLIKELVTRGRGGKKPVKGAKRAIPAQVIAGAAKILFEKLAGLPHAVCYSGIKSREKHESSGA